MDEKAIKINQLIREQFKRIDQAIKENPDRARKMTENASLYVKEQVEKIIKD
jgi:hypothetical protein